MLKNVLIIGGGQRLGLQLTKDIISDGGKKLDLFTSQDLSDLASIHSNLKSHRFDWYNFDIGKLDNIYNHLICNEYDWIYFNLNVSGIHEFKLENEIDVNGLKEIYFINNILPMLILNKVRDKITENTVISWALSGTMVDWSDQDYFDLHGDKTIYAATKSINFYYLNGYKINKNKGIYVGINMGHFGSEGGLTYEEVSKRLISTIPKLKKEDTGKYIILRNGGYEELPYIVDKLSKHTKKS